MFPMMCHGLMEWINWCVIKVHGLNKVLNILELSDKKGYKISCTKADCPDAENNPVKMFSTTKIK